MSPRRAFIRFADWSFWHYQIAGWSVFSVVMMTIRMSLYGLKWTMFLTIGLQFLALILLTFGLRRYYRGIPFQTIDLPGLIGRMIVASFVVSLVWFYCWLAIEGTIFGAKALRYAANPFNSGQLVAISFPVFLTWSALYFGIKLWREWLIERTLADSATESAEQARLQMLRYQLNPQFLFSSLHTVRALIDEDPLASKQMITDLSEFLRYSLVIRDGAHVTLREELGAVRLYLAIEHRRHEEKLITNVASTAQAEHILLPSFTLLPFVEHALRVAFRTSRHPVAIDLQAWEEQETLHIAIRHSGALAPSPSSAAEAEDFARDRIRLDQRLHQTFNGQAVFNVAPSDEAVLLHISITARKGKPHGTSLPRSDR